MPCAITVRWPLPQRPRLHVQCQGDLHNLTVAAIADNLHQMAHGYRSQRDLIPSNSKARGTSTTSARRKAPGGQGADGISIFGVVDKQLGLKLQLQNVPAPSLAIAKVSRKPSASTSEL
jgi:uncharacterized protein (TIGR03435 family)